MDHFQRSGNEEMSETWPWLTRQNIQNSLGVKNKQSINRVLYKLLNQRRIMKQETTPPLWRIQPANPDPELARASPSHTSYCNRTMFVLLDMSNTPDSASIIPYLGVHEEMDVLFVMEEASRLTEQHRRALLDVDPEGHRHKIVLCAPQVPVFIEIACRLEKLNPDQNQNSLYLIASKTKALQHIEQRYPGSEIHVAQDWNSLRLYIE